MKDFNTNILPVIHLKTITSNLQMLHNNDSPAITCTSKQYAKSAVATWVKVHAVLFWMVHDKCHYTDYNANITHGWSVINFHLLSIVTFDHT